MNRVFSVLIITGLVILAACSQKTVLFEGDGKMEEFAPLDAQYGFLNAKAKIVIEEESGKITRGTLNVRAKKDSVLWFTMSPGMGMEAVRGLITRDKIQIRDRVGRDDVNLTFAEFEKLFGLKLSLDLFQNVVWANIPYPVTYEDRLVRIGKRFELTQVRDQVRYFSKIETSHGKVSEFSSNSLDNRGTLMASFPKFQNISNQPFPSEVLFKIAFKLPEGSQNSRIHINWTSIDPSSGQLSFPFRF
jgi:hypothetical protein